MTSEAARLLERVSVRAADDPDAILPVLRALAGEAPNGRTRKLDRAAVIEINRARVLADRADFIAHSWTADKVAEHLGVRSRQAVAQRRQRGTLLGSRIGTHTYYPEWQFGPDGLAQGIDRLLDLMRGAGIVDTREMDDVLRMKHSDLRGGTLLSAWRRGEWRTLEIWLGDIGGWRR